MPLTPNALSAKISQLVKEGYPKKQAIAVAYSEMRIAWRDKHPVGKFPVWLLIESRGKNPVSVGSWRTPFGNRPVEKIRNKLSVAYKEGYRYAERIDDLGNYEFFKTLKDLKYKTSGKVFRNPISEKTAHKLRKAAPKTFMKMTDEEIKRAVKVRKNPIDGPGIVTKYIAPTNVKDARIKAYRSGEPKINKTYFYPRELSESVAHEAVAKSFMRHLGWNGTLSGAETDTGYFFVVHKVRQGAVRKNPVRPLSAKPSSRGQRKKEFTLQTFMEGRTYYWTGAKFDTLFQKAITFNSITLAKLAAKVAYKKYPDINIYLEGPGITA